MGKQNSKQCKNVFIGEKNTKHIKTKTTLPSNYHIKYLSLDDTILKLKSQLGNATQLKNNKKKTLPGKITVSFNNDPIPLH